MTTSAFWIDLTAYSLTTLVAASLFLLVLGVGIRRLLNISFALTMAAVAVWASSSVVLRVMLWFDTGGQQLWMEISTLAFMLIAPLLVTFSGIYIRTRRIWPYVIALGSLVAILAFSIPLFRHQVVYDVHLEPTGVVAWERTALGLLTSVPLFASATLALVLLWSEWRRLREPYLPIAFTILVTSSLVFSFVEFPFPTLSIAMILVIGILGYSVLNRQVFNPLRELTQRLEEQVAERTEELRNVAQERQEALRRTKRHAAHLQTAAEVARSVSAIRDTDRLLQETAQLISDRFDFRSAAIFLLGESQEYADLRAVSSRGGQIEPAYRQEIRVGETSVVGLAAETGRPQISTHDEEMGAPNTYTEMALPLKVGEAIIGVLDVRSTAEEFTSQDVATLKILADQLAVGIENTRLFTQTRSNLEELGRLYRTMTADAWEQFVETRPDVRRYQAGAREIPTEEWDSLIDRAQRENQPVSASFGDGETGGQHALAVPVRLRGVPVGALGFHRPQEAGNWRPREIQLAQSVAERMALALENVRLLEEARQRSSREQLTREVVDRVRRTSGIEQALRTTAAELSRALEVPHVSIELDIDTEGEGTIR